LKASSRPCVQPGHVCLSSSALRAMLSTPHPASCAIAARLEEAVVSFLRAPCGHQPVQTGAALPKPPEGATARRRTKGAFWPVRTLFVVLQARMMSAALPAYCGTALAGGWGGEAFCAPADRATQQAPAASPDTARTPLVATGPQMRRPAARPGRPTSRPVAARTTGSSVAAYIMACW
jgi:hypothetical protein